jgi:DNA replication and repair protein RecF
MQRALANRNALLKAKTLKNQQLAPWTQEFCHYAELVDRSRESYMQRLQPYLQDSFEHLLHEQGVSLSYQCGWDKGRKLYDELSVRQEQDRRYGHTGLGPHRADIKISSRSKPAADLLSRGQQKLLVIAMKCAQAALLSALNKEQCLFLIDDLPAELDRANRAKILSMLRQSGEQIFVTGIEAETLLNSLERQEEARLFHVKHGKIKALESPESVA